jgi:hypothetical protein
MPDSMHCSLMGAWVRAVLARAKRKSEADTATPGRGHDGAVPAPTHLCLPRHILARGGGNHYRRSRPSGKTLYSCANFCYTWSGSELPRLCNVGFRYGPLRWIKRFTDRGRGLTECWPTQWARQATSGSSGTSAGGMARLFPPNPGRMRGLRGNRRRSPIGMHPPSRWRTGALGREAKACGSGSIAATDALDFKVEVKACGLTTRR